ncbi:MAG: hypothetical protein U0931_09860 [Vulcanimicrobiota bacterium]
MNDKTIKLSGRDLLWYELREKTGRTQPRAWHRHVLVVIALIVLKLGVMAGSDGVEQMTAWISDSRGLLGWP